MLEQTKICLVHFTKVSQEYFKKIPTESVPVTGYIGVLWCTTWELCWKIHPNDLGYV